MLERPVSYQTNGKILPGNRRKMKRLALYTKYAWRSIQRGGQRSFFAILCVAVGVAAIVALQTTGYSIQDAVAGDARTNARADVVVTSRQRLFSEQDLAKID